MSLLRSEGWKLFWKYHEDDVGVGQIFRNYADFYNIGDGERKEFVKVFRKCKKLLPQNFKHELLNDFTNKAVEFHFVNFFRISGWNVKHEDLDFEVFTEYKSGPYTEFDEGIFKKLIGNSTKKVVCISLNPKGEKIGHDTTLNKMCEFILEYVKDSDKKVVLFRGNGFNANYNSFRVVGNNICDGKYGIVYRKSEIKDKRKLNVVDYTELWMGKYKENKKKEYKGFNPKSISRILNGINYAYEVRVLDGGDEKQINKYNKLTSGWNSSSYAISLLDLGGYKAEENALCGGLGNYMELELPDVNSLFDNDLIINKTKNFRIFVRPRKWYSGWWRIHGWKVWVGGIFIGVPSSFNGIVSMFKNIMEWCQ